MDPVFTLQAPEFLLTNLPQKPDALSKSQEYSLPIPVSLEITGLQNHYVLSLHALPSNVTMLNIKADFKKLAQGGRILSVSVEEVSEIEPGLFRKMNKALASPRKT
jgi:hypothetical protein